LKERNPRPEPTRRAGRAQPPRGGRDRRRSEVYRQVRIVGLALVLPFIMAAGPVVGYFIGAWIGRLVGDPFWPRMIGLAVGVAAGVHQTFQIIRRILSEMK